MADEYDDEYQASADMQRSISQVVGSAIAAAVDWDFVEAMSKPVFDYIVERWKRDGAHSVLFNGEGVEATIGMSVWDENGDDIIASQQINLSDIAMMYFRDDPGQIEFHIAAIERSVAVMRAAMEAAEQKPPIQTASKTGEII